MWIATFILLPISVYLTYKATNDSNLFQRRMVPRPHPENPRIF